MPIVFLFGILDIAAATMLFLMKWFPFLKIPLLILAALILIKSVRYFVDIASIADIAAVVFMALAAFGYYPLFTYAVVIWLLQKGIRSFI